MRRTMSALLLLILGLTGLAACGRKDVPDYPPDAIERPGVLQPRRDPIRYY
jgi:predicted small lipoprotein YifL